MTQHRDICRLQAEPGLSSALEVHETSAFYPFSWLLKFEDKWQQKDLQSIFPLFFLTLGHRVAPNRCFVAA